MATEDVMAIGDQIVALTPAKATELLAYLKEVYNLEPIAMPQLKEKPQEKQVEKPQEQTEFTVILESFDPTKKIQVVKNYRDITAAGIKEAMTAINGCPTVVKDGVSKAEAEKVKALLEGCGGKVTLK